MAIEIVENYKGWQPPVNARRAVSAVMATVPNEYLSGLGQVVLTNASGMNRSRRRHKIKYQGKTRSTIEAYGFYRQEWRGQRASIELLVDNIVARCPRAIRLAPIRDFVFADTLFHEIGHHIHATRAKEFRDSEDVADKWARRLGGLYYRPRRWYLTPLLKLFRLV